MKRKFRIFEFLFLIIFNIVFLFSLLSILIIDKKIYYINLKNNPHISNLILLAIGLIVVFALGFLYVKFFKKKLYRITPKCFNITLGISFVVIFAIQLLIVYNIYFPASWDVEVLRKASDLISSGMKMGKDFPHQSYFLAYNNNVFLLGVISLIKRVSVIIPGLSKEATVVLFNIICVNLSGVFTILTINRVIRRRGVTLFALFAYALLIMFSPWMMVPYTDTLSIVIISFLIYLYVRIRTRNMMSKREMLDWFLLFFVGVVGYFIKPTTVIVLIAIVITELYRFLSLKDRINKHRIICLVMVMVGVTCAFFVNIGVNKYLRYEANEELKTPATHFMMMGLNKKKNGTYRRKDIVYTTSFKTQKEKKDANFKEIKKRLSEYGLSGYIVLLEKKTLENYNNGTFAWGVEGDFFMHAKQKSKNVFTDFLKSVFYFDRENYSIFANVEQCIWITLLFFAVFISFRRRWLFSEVELVMILSVTGITIFTLLFEARARYLYSFVPVFITLSMMGLDNLKRIPIIGRK